MTSKNIIFDLGGVLIDWDPRYMYRSMFHSQEAMEYFLSTVCTSDWNEEQDGGRSIVEANAALTAKFPQYKLEIEAFYGRWTEMLGGPIEATVTILQEIAKKKDHRLVALTNWSAETWPEATSRYRFLDLFEGILVSGKENLKKPDPRIYKLILQRYSMSAGESVFIDDNLRNIKAAQALGIDAIHYTGSEQLRSDLESRSIL